MPRGHGLFSEENISLFVKWKVEIKLTRNRMLKTIIEDGRCEVATFDVVSVYIHAYIGISTTGFFFPNGAFKWSNIRC